MIPYFWKIYKGFTLITLAINGFINLFIEEIAERVENLLINTGILKHRYRRNIIFADKGLDLHKTTINKPIIFASACVDRNITGGWKYNGGVKELNCLIKCVRNHGYEGYIVTYDGKYDSWLIDHQPTISIKEFNKLKKSNSDIRCVTSWAGAFTFIRNSSKIYFWDMELAYSDNQFFSTMKNLYHNKIQNVAGITRTIQAWHMAIFNRKCIVLPNIIDNSIWFPKPNLRKHLNVGYMYEGTHTQYFLRIIKGITHNNGLELNFLEISGDEKRVLNLMRSCEVFLSLNIGKDKLWGEGCPRTIIEALSVGCVSISFDLVGNREIIVNNFNGIIIDKISPELMGNMLVELYSHRQRIDEFRSDSRELFDKCYKMEERWPAVKDFLEL